MNKKTILLFMLCSIVGCFLPMHSMYNSKKDSFKNNLQSKPFIDVITSEDNAHNKSVENNENDNFSFSESRKYRRRKRNIQNTVKKVSNPPVKNKYPEVFEAYCNFSTKDIDHVIERHYDPYGKKTVQGNCQKLSHKPYQGFVNYKYTTFFPQAYDTDTIYKCINNVLVNSYNVTPSTKFKNAFVVKGKFKDGVTTAVVIAKRPKWKVITAYPKFQKQIKKSDFNN